MGEIMQGQRDLSETVERVARQLVSVEHGARRSIVQLPMIYPSGSLVGIKVAHDGNGYSVTDRGVAADEAKLIRATRSFGAHAPMVAAEAGVEFDGGAFYLQRVAVDSLVGAVITVAHASYTSATLASHRQAAIDARDAEERLFARLGRLFGNVETHHEIVGASGTPWDVDAVVKADDKIILFESVLPRKQSIYATVAKYHDIARLPHAPIRVAAVSSREGLGSMLGVLSQAATVMEDGTPDSTIVRFAA